jgi:hypothetical protein
MLFTEGYLQKRPGKIHKIQQLQDGIQLIFRPGEWPDQTDGFRKNCRGVKKCWSPVSGIGCWPDSSPAWRPHLICSLFIIYQKTKGILIIYITIYITICIWYHLYYHVYIIMIIVII